MSLEKKAPILKHDIISLLKKFFTALGFAAGAVFGLFFSRKKGEELRKAVQSKKSSDQKLEVVGAEAKAMLRNFWTTIQGPLKKGLKELKKDAEKVGKDWKTKALTEIEKDTKVIKKKAQETKEKVHEKVKDLRKKLK